MHESIASINATSVLGAAGSGEPPSPRVGRSARLTPRSRGSLEWLTWLTWGRPARLTPPLTWLTWLTWGRLARLTPAHVAHVAVCVGGSGWLM